MNSWTILDFTNTIYQTTETDHLLRTQALYPILGICWVLPSPDSLNLPTNLRRPRKLPFVLYKLSTPCSTVESYSKTGLNEPVSIVSIHSKTFHIPA